MYKLSRIYRYKENYFVLVLNVRNRKIENPQFTVNFIVIEDSNNGNFFLINKNYKYVHNGTSTDKAVGKNSRSMRERHTAHIEIIVHAPKNQFFPRLVSICTSTVLYDCSGVLYEICTVQYVLNR